MACVHLTGGAFGTFFSKDRLPPGQGFEQAASILLWEEKADMQVFKRKFRGKSFEQSYEQMVSQLAGGQSVYFAQMRTPEMA